MMEESRPEEHYEANIAQQIEDAAQTTVTQGTYVYLYLMYVYDLRIYLYQFSR